MIISFVLACSEGERLLDKQDLTLPYRIKNFEEHPCLTLGDYFRAATSALLEKDAQPLISCLKAVSGVNLLRRDVDKIVVRSEKHGALYHVASIDIHAAGLKIKLALNTALSSSSAFMLEKEYRTLESLSSKENPSLIPIPFWKTKVNAGRQGEYFLFAFVRWFDDYHEWHISGRDKRNKDIITIWDAGRRYRRATHKEVYDIYRLASRLLTLYYDTLSFSQIRPWHHAAGDFVVGKKDGITDVRLISARDYSPSPLFCSGKKPLPILALIYFLLELSVRMRLDKIDGTGNASWAGKTSCHGAVDGFFEGVGKLESDKRLAGVHRNELISVIRSFEPAEYLRLLEPIADMIASEDQADYDLILSNLEDHSHDLYQTVRALRI